MSLDTLHPADRKAVEAAFAVEPAWTGLATAKEAVGLDDSLLLHAGPPFASPDDITTPILNSACVAAVLEGLAADFDRAEAMIRAGEIRLAPAQDHGVVTPLAAVVGASMPLHVVEDAAGSGARAYSPINGGSRPAARLGLRSQAVVDHLRWLNGPFADILRAAMSGPVPLIPLAAAGVGQGDDCHGRTPAATAALTALLAERLPDELGSGTDARAFMDESPSIFLNLWMAATKCIMAGAEGAEGSSFVTAAAGNGADSGIQVAGLPGRWFTVPATPPIGRFDVELPADRALGAIGDSAVVESLGLGAMAIRFSEAQMAGLGAFLPEDALERPAKLLAAVHPGFGDLGLRLGLTARAAVAAGCGIVISLGILDRLGETGRLGGGIYDVPAALYGQAVAALDA